MLDCALVMLHADGEEAGQRGRVRTAAEPSQALSGSDALACHKLGAWGRGLRQLPVRAAFLFLLLQKAGFDQIEFAIIHLLSQHRKPKCASRHEGKAVIS